MSNLPHLEGSRSFRCPRCKAYIEAPQSAVFQCPACASFHLGHSTSETVASDGKINRQAKIDGRPRSPPYFQHRSPEKARLISIDGQASIGKELRSERATSIVLSDTEFPSPARSSRDSSPPGRSVMDLQGSNYAALRNPGTSKPSLGSLSKLSRAKVIRYDRESSIDGMHHRDNDNRMDDEELHHDDDDDDDVELDSDARSEQGRGTMHWRDRRHGHNRNKDIRIDSLTVEPDEEMYNGSEGMKPALEDPENAYSSPRSAASVWRGRSEEEEEGRGRRGEEEEEEDAESVGSTSTSTTHRSTKSRRTRTRIAGFKATADDGDQGAMASIGEHRREGMVMMKMSEQRNAEIVHHIQLLPYQILIPATVIPSPQTMIVEPAKDPTHSSPSNAASSSPRSVVSTTPPPSQAASSSSPPPDRAAKMPRSAAAMSTNSAEKSAGKIYPPLPSNGAPPYIMCSHCYEVLRVPMYLPPNAGFKQKLQCGGCLKVSKFYVPIDPIAVPSQRRSSDHGDLATGTMIPDSLVHEDLYRYSPQRFHGIAEPDDDCMSDGSSSAKHRSVHVGTGRSSFSGSEASLDEESHRRNSAKEEMASIEARQNSLAPGAPLIDHLTRSRDLSPRSYRRSILQISTAKRDHSEDHVMLEERRSKASEDDATATRRSSSVASSLYHDDYPGHGHGSRGSTMSSSPLTSEDSMKGGKSSYGGLMKVFKDIGNLNKKVTVNGHTLSKEAISHAQIKAGVIHPGSYWYDYKAGFWGVMGEPCRGIIMPSIEEFNFPMARNCCGGRTGVYVNGRELHDKDLDVLFRRGLPRAYGKAYAIDILGNVTDPSTGQNLKNLGILAPTVLRRGRGCGMSTISAPIKERYKL